MKECVGCSRKFPDHMVFCPFDGDMLEEEEEDLLLGRVLDGKYRLEEKLGEGGMGTVYRARHVLIQNDVAIKVLHPTLIADRHAVARFQREATAAARIKHPNAIGVTDFGRTDDEVVYIVMELFVGRSLRDVIEQDGPLSIERATMVVRQVCLALDAAHRNGVIHRDIKPDNIVLDNSPNNGQSEIVKVLDFGIAKLKDGPANELGGRLTRQGVIIGSPHYLSPEQCQNTELDARSDIYSLGIVLYEMFTADVPFKAPTPIAVAMMHATEKPPHVKEKHPELPDPIANVVMRALEKLPINRYQSAIELAQAMEQACIDADINILPLPGSQNAFLTDNAQSRQLANQAATYKSGTHIPVVTPESYNNSVPFAEGDKLFDLKESDIKFNTTGSLSPESANQSVETTAIEKLPEKPPEKPLERPKGATGRFDNRAPSFISGMKMPTGAVQAPRSLGNTSTTNLLDFGQSAENNRDNSKFTYIIGVMATVVVIAIIIIAYYNFSSTPKPLDNPIGKPTDTTTTNPTATVPPGMVLIKGGSFKMGHNSAKAPEKPPIQKFFGPEHSVTVEAFYLDKTEVTNQDYKKFVEATKHTPPPYWNNGQFPSGEDLRPVTNVTFDDAEAYAKWADKRLPSEAEWEYAARGEDGRTYPWGDDWQEGLAISNELWDENANKNKEKKTSVVGSLPKGASPFGVLDLAGNVWEWTKDDFTPYPGNEEVVDDTLKGSKIIRGGSFRSDKKYLTAYSRNSVIAKFQDNSLGFRCAKSVK